ncbi:uncharacterized protein BJX67DRAFT_41402 [Aspergillus lucknowensis]|uniref:Uncharacterized protein n=1 Tax=Aspergillus lucknowensis TaxID=176173 RepID=A0ABR4LYR8_9EURO
MRCDAAFLIVRLKRVSARGGMKDEDGDDDLRIFLNATDSHFMSFSQSISTSASNLLLLLLLLLPPPPPSSPPDIFYRTNHHFCYHHTEYSKSTPNIQYPFTSPKPFDNEPLPQDNHSPPTHRFRHLSTNPRRDPHAYARERREHAHTVSETIARTCSCGRVEDSEYDYAREWYPREH